MTTYIHYGSDHFYPEFFIPVRNGDWRPKPADGTGLWGSRIDDEFGWEAWCRENHFNLDHLRSSFRFQLPEASILTLEDPAQLITLPKLHPWEPKKPLEFRGHFDPVGYSGRHKETKGTEHTNRQHLRRRPLLHSRAGNALFVDISGVLA